MTHATWRIGAAGRIGDLVGFCQVAVKRGRIKSRVKGQSSDWVGFSGTGFEKRLRAWGSEMENLTFDVT